MIAVAKALSNRSHTIFRDVARWGQGRRSRTGARPWPDAGPGSRTFVSGPPLHSLRQWLRTGGRLPVASGPSKRRNHARRGRLRIEVRQYPCRGHPHRRGTPFPVRGRRRASCRSDRGSSWPGATSSSAAAPPMCTGCRVSGPAPPRWPPSRSRPARCRLIRPPPVQACALARGLPSGDGTAAAAFDTRIDGPAPLTGRPRGIARRLRDHGFRLVVGPESFLVDKQSRLLAGENERATAWAPRWPARSLPPRDSFEPDRSSGAVSSQSPGGRVRHVTIHKEPGRSRSSPTCPTSP